METINDPHEIAQLTRAEELTSQAQRQFVERPSNLKPETKIAEIIALHTRVGRPYADGYDYSQVAL